MLAYQKELFSKEIGSYSTKLWAECRSEEDEEEEEERDKNKLGLG
jgi:hypothetical protein